MPIIRENKLSHSIGQSYYAVTNKGVLYGSTIAILERKILRVKAQKPNYAKVENNQPIDESDDLPF